MGKVFCLICFLGVFAFNGTTRVSAAAGRDTLQPVTLFTRQWLDIERRILTENGAGPELVTMIGDFRASLKQVFETPLYRTYQYNPLFHRQTLENVITLSGDFEEAVLQGRREAIPLLALELRQALNQWQEQDAEIGDAIHLRYFYQFFIFAALIGLLALAIGFLNRALARSRAREEQSTSFSQAVVLAQENERSRISRELHDTVAQDLRVQALRIAGIKRASEETAVLEEVAAAQRGLIDSIRIICDDLFPPDFRYQGLGDALGRLCRDFGKRTGLDCRLTLRDDPRGLDEAAQLQCFRLVQEALTNIEKHAEASEAVVVLRCEEDTLFICISDDGKGFPPSRENPAIATAGHFGIRGMYTRTAILGGSLRFESEAGEGTTVIITAPLKVRSSAIP